MGLGRGTVIGGVKYRTGVMSSALNTHTHALTHTLTLLRELPILTRPYAAALGLGAWGEPSLAPGVRGLSGRVVARCLSVQQKRALSPGLPTVCWGSAPSGLSSNTSKH